MRISRGSAAGAGAGNSLGCTLAGGSKAWQSGTEMLAEAQQDQFLIAQ
jgi:hypothetical protein